MELHEQHHLEEHTGHEFHKTVIRRRQQGIHAKAIHGHSSDNTP